MLHIIVWQVLGCFQPDAADAEPLVFSALESIHAALAIMTHHDMPKQLYREEVYTFWVPSPSYYETALLRLLTFFFFQKLWLYQLIERIIDLSRHQIMDCMAASNPTFRALYKPAENVTNDGSLKIKIHNSTCCYYYLWLFMIVQSQFAF